MKIIKQIITNVIGFINNITIFTPEKVLIKNCSTCRFNNETNCSVGTYLAKMGKKDICYDGELWNSK